MLIKHLIAIIYFTCTFYIVNIDCLDQKNGSACITPNGEKAICRSVYSCPILLNEVPPTDGRQGEFIRKSQCGYDQDPLVCCGTMNNYIKTAFDYAECGYKETNSTKELPWLAVLMYRNQSDIFPDDCEGTLISKRYVLSNILCTRNTAERKLISVRLGKSSKEGEEFGSPDVKNIDIESITIPHRYVYHNIVLIKLSIAVEYTKYIRPICLPASDELLMNDKAFMIADQKTGLHPCNDLTIKLRRFVNRVSTGVEDCTYAEGCPGIVGFPLMKISEIHNSRWYVEGIATECDMGIIRYIQVSYNRKWINDNVHHN